jgi:hypothetical protein
MRRPSLLSMPGPLTVPVSSTNLLALAVLFTFALAPAETASVDLPKIHYATVAPGLGYAHIRETNAPWSIHIARLARNRKDFEIITTLGTGKIQGMAPLTQQVASVPRALGRPLAAINGDFFLIKPGPYQGDPEGLQIIDRELVSAPADKCFWAEANGSLHIGVVYPRHEVFWPNGNRTPLALNQTPPRDGATLFTPTFGDTTKATNSTEIVLEEITGRAWLPLRVDETYGARVQEIHPAGNTPLARGLMVLTVTGTTTTNLAALKPGDAVSLTTATSVNISKATLALGGGPVLVRDGKEEAWPSKKGIADYVQPRHPRTAIGFNARYLYLVAVDGRQKELSAGMSLVELAALMKQIGCREALNLDGGGSTTFWLNGKVMNSPSDKHERAIANALVIVRKTK